MSDDPYEMHEVEPGVPEDKRTLPDWFAGQAVAGYLSHPEDSGDPENVAILSYEVADAMMKEREQ